jgi:hypothetical protein
MKIDYKKDYKELYLPKGIAIVSIPKMKFIVVEGEGDPNNNKEFQEMMEALYSFSYTVKMSYKKNKPEGYYEYTVFPLEGVWDLIDKTKSCIDKSNFKFRIMIRQPEFLTNNLFDKFLLEVKNKKQNKYLNQLIYEEVEEGLCCQTIHAGSYDDEPSTFSNMEEYCKLNGYQRASKIHREIYLSDPRKVDNSKLRTLLRFKVNKI